MRKFIAIAIAALLAAPCALAEGEVYRWKDANGVWHYSDQPQPGAELVKTARRSTSTSNNAPVPPAAQPPVANPPIPPPLPELSREVTQQVRQEAATAKAAQCKKAEEDYTKAVQARRMYKTDDKGNRTFLNDAELDAARLQARSARDLACGPT